MISMSNEKWRPFNCFFIRVWLRTYQYPCMKGNFLFEIFSRNFNTKKQTNFCVSAVTIPSSPVLQGLRLSQQRCWRFRSSGMWHCAARCTVPTFQRIIMPSSSHSNRTLLGKFDPDSEGTKILRSVRIYRAMHCIMTFWSTTAAYMTVVS
jgi:hypothetical protein